MLYSASYTYTPAGLLASSSNSPAQGPPTSTSYGYNLADELTALTPSAPTPGPNQGATSFIYDPAGSLTATSVSPGTTTTLSYNSGSELTTLDVFRQHPGASLTAKAAYAYNPLGERTSETVTTGQPGPPAPVGPGGVPETLSYGYNSLGEMTSYTGNVGGSATGITGTANGAGRVPVAAAVYGYDPSGLLASRTVTAARRTTCPPGTPASRVRPGVTSQPCATASTGTARSTSYVWNVESAIPTLIGAGSYYYIYGPAGTPIEQIGPADSVLDYLAGRNDSTVALADPAGKLVARYHYSPYGTLTCGPPSSASPDVGTCPGTVTKPVISTSLAQAVAANKFLYDGQYLDTTSGLYYLRARWYDPTTASFTSVDPLVAITGEPYSYAGDDPVNNSDPSGLCLNSKGINVGGACSAAQLAAQHQQLLQAEAQMRAADAAAAACTNAFTCAINDPAAVAASFNANRSTIITNVAVVAAAGAVVLTAGAATPLVAEAAGTAFVAGDVTGDFVAVSAMTDGAASLTSAGTAFGYVSLGAGFVGTANACLPQLGGSFGATCALNAGATAIGVGAAWAGGIGGALAGLFSSPAGYFNLDQTQCQG